MLCSMWDSLCQQPGTVYLFIWDLLHSMLLYVEYYFQYDTHLAKRLAMNEHELHMITVTLMLSSKAYKLSHLPHIL